MPIYRDQFNLASILQGGADYDINDYTEEVTYFPTSQNNPNNTNAYVPGNADAYTFNQVYPSDWGNVGPWNTTFTMSAQDLLGQDGAGFGIGTNFMNFPTVDELTGGQQAAGGGGGSWPGAGGSEDVSEIEWILGDYDVGGEGPDWWRPFTVSDSEHFSNPMVSSTLMMNALIGSGALSEEDSRSMAKQLYAIWGGQTADNPWDLYSTKFGEREDMFGSPTMQGTFDPLISEQQIALGQTGPGVISMDTFSRDRSEQILDALSLMREATVGGNVDEFGPGYQYLQEVAGTLGEAGSGPASRAERQQILGALDPMLAMSQGGGELGAFSQMAQALANPFHTNLPPNVSRTQAGDYQFGRQNKNLFF